jgi:cobalt-precorrin-7 (C5)-methyltransferase
MGWIVIISGGPGGPEYITTSAKNRAQRCEVLVGSKNQLMAIEPVSGQEIYEETDVERIMEIIEKHKDREVGVVVTGDAGIYSLAQRIIERFGKESVKEIIPGVSSLQVAFAMIKEPWLNVRVFSYHGRPIEGLDDILTYNRVAILCDREHNSKVILEELIKHGLFEKRRDIYVCQELTLPEERIIRIKSTKDIEAIVPKRREIVIIVS